MYGDHVYCVNIKFISIEILSSPASHYTYLKAAVTFLAMLYANWDSMQF